MYVKEFRSHVKAAGAADGLKEGQVRAIVSVFNNIDSVGDVVMPGAFDEDLVAWASKGDPIPAIWSHDWRDPFSHIGTVIEATPVEKGLETLYEIDLDNPKAAQVYRLLKGRRVTQSSFAYDIVEADWATRKDEATGHEYEVYELRKLHLIEVGPTLVGANQETELLAVKSAEFARSIKAGRVLSAKNFESLKAAHEAIGGVLNTATPADDDKTSGREPVASKDAASQTTDTAGQSADDAANDNEAGQSRESSAQPSSVRSAKALQWLELASL
jgi:uncharacterized protein